MIKTSISNYKKLLNRALLALEDRIDSIFPEGKFILVLDPDNPKEVKINIVLTSNGKGSFVKYTGKNYKIVIDTSYNDKEDCYGVLAHEITHISQAMNGFRDFDFSRSLEDYKRKKYKNYNDYYNEEGHSKRYTESEANLVQFFIILDKRGINKGFDFLLERSEYFKFGFKEFSKKSFLFGVSKETINLLREKVIIYARELLNLLEIRAVREKDQFKLEDMFFSVVSNIKELRNVMFMLNINIDVFYLQLVRINDAILENGLVTQDYLQERFKRVSLEWFQNLK